MSFKNSIKLSGIIFLHRISDRRMAGSARRNLIMFKKLCGEKAYQSVVLASSMWSEVTPDVGDARERELIQTEEFWGLMCKKGSKVLRYANTRESALNVVDYIPFHKQDYHARHSRRDRQQGSRHRRDLRCPTSSMPRSSARRKKHMAEFGGDALPDGGGNQGTRR